MRVLRSCFHASSLLLVVACSACVDVPGSPTTHALPGEIVNTISVSPDALLMAVGDSIPLTVAAKNVFGDVLLLDSTPVVWSSSDVTRVTVDENGMLHALHAVSDDDLVYVIASATHGGATRIDSVAVSISTVRRPIAGIRIAVKDSTRIPASAPFAVLSVIAIDSGGTQVGTPRLPVFVSDTMPSSALVVWYLGPIGILLGLGQYQVINQAAIGDFWVYTRGTIYGVPMRDSVKLTGLYPAAQTVTLAQDSASGVITSLNSGHELIAQPCGTIRFTNTTSATLDVVFDEPLKATGCAPGDPTGDIFGLSGGTTLSRKFRNSGTVTWAVRHSATGALIPRLTGRITMKEPYE